MKKRIVLGTVLLLAALTLSAAALQRQQQRLADKLVRLHVVAHSDSPADQQIKLKVRDAVLQTVDGMDRETLESSLSAVRNAAETCLRELGRDDGVTVSLGRERFPTRFYETFALPAGVYRSLRVTVGDGAGQNWWCVVFPSICFRAAAELEEAAVSAGFTEEEVRFITGESGYVLKFKTLELLDRLKTALFG